MPGFVGLLPVLAACVTVLTDWQIKSSFLLLLLLFLHAFIHMTEERIVTERCEAT